MTPASRAPDLVPRGGQGSLREQGREAGVGAGGGGHSPWPSGRAASPEDRCKQGSRHTQRLFTWEPDTPCCESSFMDRLQPADYSAAALVSPRGSKSLHKETGPRPGCIFSPGNLPGANSYASCQEKPGWTVLGEVGLAGGATAGWGLASHPFSILPPLV